ncbi:MAG: hypothetical protein R2689_07490 [Microthrixaceae bacterium]
MARVLDLHLREVLVGRPVQVHAATRIQAEVGGVGGAEEAKAQPVRVVAALALRRSEEALRGGVGTNDQGDVAQSGHDALTGGFDGHDPRRTGAVGRGHRNAGPAHRLGERRAGHIAGVAVAHRVGAGDELDVAVVDVGVCDRVTDRCDAVLDEVAAPLAPRVHPRSDDDDLVDCHH